MRGAHPNSCGGPGDCWRCDYKLDARNEFISFDPPKFPVHIDDRQPCPAITADSIRDYTKDPARVTCPACAQRIAATDQRTAS